jgi:MGT family glycosyltransferase
MARIGVVNVPFYSHVEAATRLSEALLRLGHELVVWAPEPCREGVEKIGASFQPQEVEMPPAGNFMQFAADMAAVAERHTQETIEDIHAADLDVLVHDSQAVWARVAGEYLGLPRMVSHPMFPWSTSHKVVPAVDQIELESDPEADRERFEASWRAVAFRWGVELGQWHHTIHSTDVSDTTIAYTTERMVGGWGPEGWNFVGPLMTDVPISRPEPDARPLVYVCFGTSFNYRKHLFAAVIEGLADEPVDVLVSTGMGKVSPADLEPLPDNVVVEEFAKNREVLERASVHITHSGCNSVHESLLAGVPMLSLPQAYDQYPLAYRVQDLGASRVVMETPTSVRDGLRWLLEDPSGSARARELGGHLRRYDGDGRVAAVLDRALAGGPARAA